MKEKKIKPKKLMSMQELLKSGRLYWIKSPQTLKKWVERDISRRNILKTQVIENDGRGKRYYFTSDNVEKYLEAFHGGRLDCTHEDE